MTTEERSALIKVQATLAAISNGHRPFFNVALYVNRLGLVRAHGTDYKGRTHWILTEKGKQILNVPI